MCEQQYFIEYVLGWRGPSNQKADKGTIVHKVLELLAVIKKAQQDKLVSVEDEIAGTILVNNYTIDNLYDIVYEYYTKANAHHKWTDKDRIECRKWVDKTLEFNNGMFDPRNRDIVCPEQHFDFIIDRPWAKYSYDTPEGKLEGQLALKGTIDLITRIDDNFFEIIDWKTGRRLDWATGKEKTQEKLENDPQLMIYHYAVSQLYPEVDNIMVTINFINDGGPFSIGFQKSDLPRTEHMLRHKFEKIKAVKKPQLHKTWMCSKLCHFGKTTFDNSPIEPLEEYRDGQVTPNGAIMSKCQQIHHDIQIHGMGETVSKYKHPNHSFGFYKAPGE